MIDIETLSTDPSALVVSIGAVRFGNRLGEEFYKPCFFQQKDRKMDISTIRWWMQQEEAGRNVFKEEAVSLREALIELRDFIDREDRIWANGAIFDIGILQNALTQYKQKLPWKYPNILCLRSIRAIHPEYDQLMNKLIRGESASHNALDDAKCQAKALILLSQLKDFKL